MVYVATANNRLIRFDVSKINTDTPISSKDNIDIQTVYDGATVICFYIGKYSVTVLTATGIDRIDKKSLARQRLHYQDFEGLNLVQVAGTDKLVFACDQTDGVYMFYAGQSSLRLVSKAKSCSLVSANCRSMLVGQIKDVHFVAVAKEDETGVAIYVPLGRQLHFVTDKSVPSNGPSNGILGMTCDKKHSKLILSFEFGRSNILTLKL